MVGKNLQGTKDELKSYILTREELLKYFPKSYTLDKMSQIIYKLLDGYVRKRSREQSI